MVSFAGEMVAMYLSLSVVVFVASGGGIGGGTVFVPLIAITTSYDIKVAVGLSSCTIFGSMLAQLTRNARKPHPSVPSRHCIDWMMLTLVQPATVVGAVTGTFLNKIIADSYIHIFLSTLLLALSVVTTRRVWLLFSAPKPALGEVEMPGEQPEVAAEVALPDKLDPAAVKVAQPEPISPAGDLRAGPVGKESILAEVLTVFGFFALVLIFNLLKGSGGGVNLANVECGSLGYWCLSLAPVPVAVVICLIARARMLAKKPEVEGDVVWTACSISLYPLLCFGVGLLAGMFGIGGAIMNGPIMLELGMLPEVASATSSTSNLFTSGSASVSYLFFGTLDHCWGVALGLFCMGFVGTILGRKFFESCHLCGEQSQRKSIVLVIAAIVVVSALISLGQTIIELVDQGISSDHAVLCS